MVLFFSHGHILWLLNLKKYILCSRKDLFLLDFCDQ